MHELILAGCFIAALVAVAIITILQAREWMKAFLLVSDQFDKLLKHMDENVQIGGQPLKLYHMEREAAEKRETAEREMELEVQKMRMERQQHSTPRPQFDPRS